MDWKPIDTAPKDGTRVRVGHELDPSSMKEPSYFHTSAIFENGGWHCSAWFTCRDGLLRTEPTHWYDS